MKICYFTATGNCLYVAKRIGGELLSIPQLMRSGELEISDDVVGIISPVYAGEMPGMVRDFIGKIKICADYVFYIYTYGMSESVARPNAIAACQKAELKLDYINAVKMVDNYLPGFEAQDQIDTAGKKDIEGQLDRVCLDIAERKKNVTGIGVLQKIGMNQYPEESRMKSNINEDLVASIIEITGLKQKEAEIRILYYTYAVMCSQVYLEKFRGVLYTPNQSDARTRIPFVADKQTFLRLSAYGEKIAKLEKIDHQVTNVLGYDYEDICNNVPHDFKIIPKQPFDDVNEELVLKNDEEEIRIHCPLYLQKLSIQIF